MLEPLVERFEYLEARFLDLSAATEELWRAKRDKVSRYDGPEYENRRCQWYSARGVGCRAFRRRGSMYCIRHVEKRAHTLQREDSPLLNPEPTREDYLDYLMNM